MKDARGFLKHASLSSNDGLVINREGGKKDALVRLQGRLGVDSSPDLRGAPRHLPRGKRLMAAVLASLQAQV